MCPLGTTFLMPPGWRLHRLGPAIAACSYIYYLLYYCRTYKLRERWYSIFNNEQSQWPKNWVQCFAQRHLSCGIEGGESTGYSLPPPTIPASPETQICNLGYESDSLTIRPRLPDKIYLNNALKWHLFLLCISLRDETRETFNKKRERFKPVFVCGLNNFAHDIKKVITFSRYNDFGFP